MLALFKLITMYLIIIGCVQVQTVYTIIDNSEWRCKQECRCNESREFETIFNTSMEKRGSAELLGTEQSNSKNASSDSLNSDSKSSSLNSKMGQESV